MFPQHVCEIHRKDVDSVSLKLSKRRKTLIILPRASWMQLTERNSTTERPSLSLCYIRLHTHIETLWFENAYIRLTAYTVISLVQSLSHVQLFVTPWTAARQASLSITNSRSLLKLMSIESVMPSNHLILCPAVLLPPSIPPSIRVFSIESVLHIRWPKYWSFSISISPSNEYSGLISFRMDWLDLLVGQGTLKSLLQHHCSKAQLFGAQLFL